MLARHSLAWAWSHIRGKTSSCASSRENGVQREGGTSLFINFVGITLLVLDIRSTGFLIDDLKTVQKSTCGYKRVCLFGLLTSLPVTRLSRGRVPTLGEGGAVAQSVERATPGEEVWGLIPAVAVRSLLVGSVSV